MPADLRGSPPGRGSGGAEPLFRPQDRIRDPIVGQAPIVSVVRAGGVDGCVRFVTSWGRGRSGASDPGSIVLAAPEEKVVRPAGG